MATVPTVLLSEPVPRFYSLDGGPSHARLGGLRQCCVFRLRITQLKLRQTFVELRDSGVGVGVVAVVIACCRLSTLRSVVLAVLVGRLGLTHRSQFWCIYIYIEFTFYVGQLASVLWSRVRLTLSLHTALLRAKCARLVHITHFYDVCIFYVAS